MRVWVDISNSPHVALFEPVIAHMRGRGWDVFLTARDHAQTAELALERWPETLIVGAESPRNRLAKGASMLSRSARLAVAGRRLKPDVALSHGSYAQLTAAKSLRVRSVTMMDYEFQPANHVSFRLAKRVIVPEAFPASQLKRFGATETKVRRYEGFKEELYLVGFEPSSTVLDGLGVDLGQTVVVLRPPPSGALYHPSANEQFERIVKDCADRQDIAAIMLPRTRDQRARYGGIPGLIVPDGAVDGLSLVALADAVIGAGGTMNREAALLGTPTYTLFAGRLAAVDAKLVELGYMQDLRMNGDLPRIERGKPKNRHATEKRSSALLALIVGTVQKTS